MVEVVASWRPGCPHRERAWRWLRNRYEAEGWNVVAAPAPPGPWSKGAALRPTIEASRADIVVQADADVWTDGLPEAIEAVEHGAPWAIPHDLLHRLSEEDTAAVIEGADWRGMVAEQPAYPGIEGGGIVVASKGVIQSIPIDARFTGWG